MEKRVSAVVPVYNSVNTLERGIRSLLIQPEINEIFIVDDGSSDGSYELARRLELEHSLIKVLTHEKRINIGASAARNLGLKYCTNEWIQFLDADDELLKDKVANQIVLTSESVPLVVGVSKVISSKRSFLRKPFSDIWSGLLFTRLGDTCCNLWNRVFIENVGYWNENLVNSQDYDLIFRLLKKSIEIRFSSSCDTIIYISENSISTNKVNWNEKMENFVRQRGLVREYLKSNNLFSLKRNYYFSAYVGTIYRKNQITKTMEYSTFLFLVYKFFKFFSDRF